MLEENIVSNQLETNKTSKNKKKWWKILLYIFGWVFIVVCGLLIFFNVTHSYHKVDKTSMQPTLNAKLSEGINDGVFVSKIKKYTRGDIVVANRPSQNKMVIKRLIALGGDKVTVKFNGSTNKYQINIILAGQTQAKTLNEDYIGESDNLGLYEDFSELYYKAINNLIDLQTDGEYIIIPDNQVFLLGDNRTLDGSEDCADYGPILQKNIIGKVDYIAYGDKHIYWQVIQQIFNRKS